MTLFNIVFRLNGQRYVDQVYAETFMDAAAKAFVKYGDDLVSVARA